MNLYISWYDFQRKGEAVHSPRSCLPGGGWQMRDFGQRELPGISIEGPPLRVNRSLIELGNQRQLVYYWLIAGFSNADESSTMNSQSSGICFGTRSSDIARMAPWCGIIRRHLERGRRGGRGSPADRCSRANCARATSLHSAPAMHYLLPFVLAMVVTMAGLPLLVRLAGRWNIVDLPGARKVHTTPIPRVGGLAMACGVAAAALLTMHLESTGPVVLARGGRGGRFRRLG